VPDKSSVVNPGSGPFLPPRCGIRIRYEFSPDLLTMTKTVAPKHKNQEKSKFAFYFSCRIRDEKMFESGMRKLADPDPG
jgi:hypothetical protein